MIVDGAVEDNTHPKQIVDEGLVRTLTQVHDAQPAMAEAAAPETEYSFPIRTTARLRFRHIRNGPYIGKLLVET
jgi:hypothetical protein